MLHPHSLLWHYLWIGPHILQAFLTLLLCRRGFSRRFPVFFAYLAFEAVEEFTLYAMDVVPLGSVRAWWLAFCAGLIVEGTLRLGVIRELLSHLLRSKPAIANSGIRLFGSAGVVLLFLAAAAAAYAPMDRPHYVWTYRAHLLLQSFYIVQCGLILLLFVFAAHFRLTWDRQSFAIALGFGIVFCQHMGAWAVVTSGIWSDRHHLLEFINMGTYHLCVLIWCYYLLVPHKSAITSAGALPENNLAAWNRELERLLQP
jgi:hypothetical protein